MMRSLVWFGLASVLWAVAPTAAVAQTGQQSSAERTMRATENSPFIGTWELDKSQTKLGERKVKFEAQGDMIRFTNPMGAQYTFKLDGSEHPTDMPGETVAWKRTGDNSYEVVFKENGKVASTSKRELSADKNTVTVTTTGEADGQPFNTKTTFQRESGTAGENPLIGTWTQTRDLASLPATLTYAPTENGFLVTYEGPNAPRDKYTLIFDGQDRKPAEEYRTGMTVAAKRIDDHTIEESWKAEGKPFSSSTIKVTPDGRRLTETQHPSSAGAEASVFAYQKKTP